MPVITDCSYRGLVNFPGVSLLQCIFLTAIFMYIIDRKFIRAAIWSLLAGFFALFGLIHAASVGILLKNTDDAWRFSVAYVMMVVWKLHYNINWLNNLRLNRMI
jgi:hypothetical protein